MQAQDPRGARLAMRVRIRGGGSSAADVDRALSEDRSLVISWLCRGTLHLVAAEDFHWLHALSTPPLVTACLRRLAQEGVSVDDAERAVRVIVRALGSEGRLGRDGLREHLTAAGLRTEGQALVHLLFLAAVRRLIVRGPMAGRQHAYVLVDDWLGPPRRLPEREQQLAELARRYLVGHGPASDRDLARWAGLPLRDARSGLAEISRELADRDDGLLALRRAPVAAALPPPRLLGAFDPVLVGWKDRGFVTGSFDGAVVSGGVFRAFALVAGRAAAVWRVERGSVEVSPLERLAVKEEAALRADADDVIRFLGLGGATITSRTPRSARGGSAVDDRRGHSVH